MVVASKAERLIAAAAGSDSEFGADSQPEDPVVAKNRSCDRHFTMRRSTLQVNQMLSPENSSLLRGVSFARTLRSFGSIWSRSEGTVQDYSLSEPVSRIDHFLSHSWSTPYLKKFITLSVFYNIVPASIFKVFLWLALTLVMHRPLLTFLFVQVVWLVLLFTWHEVYSLLGMAGPVVFLDKACIHQTDKEMKLKGIGSLPAFLARSQRLVILYSSIYLNRLWTVYELAMYLMMHEESKIQLLPVDVPLLPLIVFQVIGAASCFCPGWWLVVPTLMGNLLVALFCQWWVDLEQGILNHFRNFDFRTTNCECEEDRPVLEGNIEAFMKHSHRVASVATTEETLSAFNHLIRESMPDMVRRSLGSNGHCNVGLPFRFMLLAYTPGVMQAFGQFWHAAWTGSTLAGACIQWMVDICYAFTICPLAVGASVYLARAFAQKGLAYAHAIAALTIAYTMAKWLLSAPLLLLALMAEAFPAWALLGYVVISSALMLATYVAFHHKGSDNACWPYRSSSGGSDDEASLPSSHHSGESDAEAGLPCSNHGRESDADPLLTFGPL